MTTVWVWVARFTRNPKRGRSPICVELVEVDAADAPPGAGFPSRRAAKQYQQAGITRTRRLDEL